MKQTVRTDACDFGATPPRSASMFISLRARRRLLVRYGLRPTLPINLPPPGGKRSTSMLFVVIRRRRTRTQSVPGTWDLQLTKKSNVAFPVHLRTRTPPRRRRRRRKSVLLLSSLSRCKCSCGGLVWEGFADRGARRAPLCVLAVWLPSLATKTDKQEIRDSWRSA